MGKEFNQILAIVRVGSKPSDPVFYNPKVRLIYFNFEEWASLELQIRSYLGASRSSFFCCLGTTIRKAGSEESFKKVDRDYVVAFAKLAQFCHAESLQIVSALGADQNSSVFYNRIKGEMEERVQEVFKDNLHFARPSLLLGDRDEFRFGERIAVLFSPLYSFLLVGSLKKYKPVSAEKVARALYLISIKKIKSAKFIENDQLLKL